MTIIDMGDLQDDIASLNSTTSLDDAKSCAIFIVPKALVAIAEQLAEANGYLAAISKRMDQVYERAAVDAEPRIKDCTTCKHKNVQFDEQPCADCGIGNPDWEPA